MIWVTRAGGNVDRVACPWLIRRFIDANAQFLFVPASEVIETARRLGGRSYDADGADFTHRETPAGDQCSFVTLLHAFGLWGTDAALDEVGRIVNHADTRPGRSPFDTDEGEGLRAIAHGFAALTTDDHQKLVWEFPLYDALYAECQRRIARPHP